MQIYANCVYYIISCSETSSFVVMTSSVAMVIPGHELNCDNKIAANTMENPYLNFKFVFPYKRPGISC